MTIPYHNIDAVRNLLNYINNARRTKHWMITTDGVYGSVTITMKDDPELFRSIIDDLMNKSLELIDKQKALIVDAKIQMDKE